VRAVFVPLWSAYPAVGFGDRDALPSLRSEAADRLGGGLTVTWPIAGLHLIAESARLGLRELDRLGTAAAQRRTMLADNTDRRSLLPDTIEALLRAPVLTPKTLSSRLKVAPQTATALLRELQGRGVAREVTGRGSFRAFTL
jgi:Fic family protein